MLFEIENNAVNCITDSGYLALILETDGELIGSNRKGLAHCESKDLIDLGRKIEELQGGNKV